MVMSKKNHKGISRRQFIKTAGAGIVGTAFGAPSLGVFARSAPSAKPPMFGLAAERTGTIRVAWEAVKKLDPAFVSTDSEIAFINAVYDYLIDLTTTDALAPRLAKSWKFSDDGLQVTFDLVSNATFHDGKKLTAEDVVYTFNRLKDEKVGSPKASLYANVKDIKAKDDVTVVFTLAKTQPDFLYNVADSSAVIVPAGSTKLDTTFIGSGPFKLDKFTPEDRAVFIANDKYWAEGLPKLAGMEHIYMDSNAAIEALRGGSIDVVLRMPNSRFVALKQEADIQTSSFPTSGHDVLRLRVDKEPGNNPKVIQALKMATNREEINQVAQLGLGATGRDAPIGPYFKDYFLPDAPLPKYDPDAAKKLLAEAGYPDGLTIDLHVPNTGGRPDFATVIKDQWAKAGVTVNIKLEDESTYYSDNGWLDVSAGITGWGARPTPQQYLDFSLRSNGKWNETKIKDPELDKLIDLAGSSLDRATRIKAYKDIQTLLADHGPLVIPYFFPIVGAARKTFNFEDGFQPFAGRTDFRRALLVAK
jgi:peptide/nickel transport system substrate-binding protein